ncbi:hypothetical protein CCR75_009753 [Bremia lactucae]|uniref:Multicopper oxidase n=1 Tax=Bremia lactucae TaxID=4779 RepID=A0A976FM64_BRELC|nr:hypothetical protein CCR75_009753 [Bremia lactucae]
MRQFSTLLTLLLSASPASARLVHYEWDITRLTNTALFDGVLGKFGYGINNEPAEMHPIIVTFGDEVEVRVTNKLTEMTCIHWHGLRQFGTQEMDGISGITQCQIQPNVTAIYHFTPDKCGSFWFHGHEEVQYAFGLRGPLIVHCPEDQKQSWEKDVEEEYTVMITDWYHDLPAGGPPIWDTVLINEIGRYDCSAAQSAGFECGPNRPLPRFQFVAGKKYLLRLINTAALAVFNVSIDDHMFQVVASDSEYLVPSTPINSLTINVGQRYDILVEANPISTTPQLPTQNSDGASVTSAYWLRVQGQFGIPWTGRPADQVPNGFNPNALAIIDYGSGNTPTSTPWSLNVTIGEFDFNPVNPLMLPQTPDQRIIVEFNLAVLPPNPTAVLGYVALNGGNFSSLVIPNYPPLYTIAQGAFTEDLPATANAIRLKYNDHIEFVVVNETPDQHPFHMHAHSLFVTGTGTATLADIRAGNLPQRLNGPMLHDVFTVPACETDSADACTTKFGYTIFRMNADNPGVWMMHCHIDWHFVLGLGMLIVEGEDRLHAEGLDAFSPNMLLSVCKGNFSTSNP